MQYTKCNQFVINMQSDTGTDISRISSDIPRISNDILCTSNYKTIILGLSRMCNNRLPCALLSNTE